MSSANLFSKKRVWILVAVAALGGSIVGAAIAYRVLDAQPALELVSAERKVLYYRNPMGTGHVSDKPMKDEMGMDYVPVYADDATAAQGNGIRIDPGMAQNIGVRTVKVTKGNIAGEIAANGVLALDEAGVGIVTARAGGYIEKLYVSAVGQRIKVGDPLFDIYSPDLIAAFEEYLSAVRYQDSLPLGGQQMQHRNATDLVVGAHKRLELLGINKSQLRRVQAENAVPRLITLHATQDGVVLKKNAIEGAYIAPGTELFTIADLSRLWVLADVYAADFAAMRPGQRAAVQVQGLPGKTFNGKVDFIYPTLAAETRTAKVRIVLHNVQGLLRPDMFASVVIQGGTQKAQLLIPKSAVLRTGKQDVVMVANGENRYRPQAIRLGAEGREHYAVLSGVKEGDEVVTSAQFLLDSESRVQEAVNKMQEGDEGAGGGAHEAHAPAKPPAKAAVTPKATAEPRPAPPPPGGEAHSDHQHHRH